mgnify:CR=1 FL=1
MCCAFLLFVVVMLLSVAATTTGGMDPVPNTGYCGEGVRCESDYAGLSAGAVAGIVIGAIVFVVIIMVVIILVVRRRRRVSRETVIGHAVTTVHRAVVVSDVEFEKT